MSDINWFDTDILCTLIVHHIKAFKTSVTKFCMYDLNNAKSCQRSISSMNLIPPTGQSHVNFHANVTSDIRQVPFPGLER